MAPYVIVAIPEEQDPVWRYSSEKIPHMTMLYLDESLDEEHAALFLQHISENSLKPFYLSVERRGELGPDKADVLFFEQRSYGGAFLSGVRDARGYLLQDAEIKKAYDAVEQYPVWTPHLTMGYPTSPAKPDNRDYPNFHGVQFDRLALWTSEYDGPEFQLKYPERDTMSEVDASWSDKAVDWLAHHGVKGQKWGVRNDNGHQGERAKTKQIAKLDKLFEKGVTLDTVLLVHNRAAENYNKFDVDRINAKKEYDGADFTRDSPLRQKYYKEQTDAFLDNIRQAAKDLGTNASGTREFSIYERPNQGGWDLNIVDRKKAAHADVASSFHVDVKYDAKGLVKSVGSITENEMKQSESLEAFLAHHGVKGQKWGVRRELGGSNLYVPGKKKPIVLKKGDGVEDGKVFVGQKVGGGTKVQAAGGRGFKAHDDAKQAAAAKQVAKNSTTDALSTQELQALVTRMNLEQQYSKLTNPQNANNANYLKKGNETFSQIIQARKNLKTMTDDPFVKDAMDQLARDTGLDRVMANAIRKVVK